MAIQFSVATRNARLDSIETTIGTAARLKIFESTGTPPANVAAADNGTVLVDMTLDSDWMAAASSGSKAKAGTWQDASANATGVADYFRVYASDGTTCHIQGLVGGTGSGDDMELDNINIASGQQVTITTFTLTDGNA